MPEPTIPTLQEYKALLRTYTDHAIKHFKAGDPKVKLLLRGLTVNAVYDISLAGVFTPPEPLNFCRPCDNGACVPTHMACMRPSGEPWPCECADQPPPDEAVATTTVPATKKPAKAGRTGRKK